MDETSGNQHDQAKHRLQALEIRTYPYGRDIVREGDNPPCFFVILSGQVRLSKSGKVILHLGDQDVFALDHLMLKKPCLYTATAMAESRIAAYGPEGLDHLIRNSPRMTHSIMTSLSRQLTKLGQNAAQAGDSISLRDLQVQFFRDGETILEEGSLGKEFFRLVSTQGGLRVSIKNKEISRITAPGEFFGEMAGMLDLPRQATITSIGESVVEKYNLEDIETIIRDYPEIALKMMRGLIARLIGANLKLTENDF